MVFPIRSNPMFVFLERLAMSHPDPLYDPDNSYEDDDMAYNYDDHDDYYEDYNEMVEDGADQDYDDTYDDSMDGDHESGLASAGFGMDEDYGGYQDDIDAFEDYYGEDF